MPVGEKGVRSAHSQPSVLECLLAAPARDDFPGPDFKTSAKHMLGPLQKAVFGNDDNVDIDIVGGSAMALETWHSRMEPGAVIIAYLQPESGRSACFFVAPILLVRVGFLRFLGSDVAPGPFVSRQGNLSRMENAYAERIAPSIGETICKLAEMEVGQFVVSQIGHFKLPGHLRAASGSMIDLTAHCHGVSHAISIAFTRLDDNEKISGRELAPVKTAPEKSAVVAGILDTKVKVDVVLRMKDQTLERLNRLKTGDVLEMLPTRFSEANVTVRGRPLFVGQVGQSDDCYSLKITDPAKSAFARSVQE